MSVTAPLITCGELPTAQERWQRFLQHQQELINRYQLPKNRAGFITELRIRQMLPKQHPRHIPEDTTVAFWYSDFSYFSTQGRTPIATIIVGCESCGRTGITRVIKREEKIVGIICGNCQGRGRLKTDTDYRSFIGKPYLYRIEYVAFEEPSGIINISTVIPYTAFLVGKLPRNIPSATIEFSDPDTTGTFTTEIITQCQGEKGTACHGSGVGEIRNLERRCLGVICKKCHGAGYVKVRVPHDDRRRHRSERIEFVQFEGANNPLLSYDDFIADRLPSTS